MAVKATATVTISVERDISATYRFYKLQSSTANPPSKPTSISTLPPSGWSTTEPSYTSGSTNTLYTVDLTVFTDGTFSYTSVNVSSSYEAAKQAYNLANTASGSVTTLGENVEESLSGLAEQINGQRMYAITDSAGATYTDSTTGDEVANYTTDETSYPLYIDADTGAITRSATSSVEGEDNEYYYSQGLEDINNTVDISKGQTTMSHSESGRLSISMTSEKLAFQRDSEDIAYLLAEDGNDGDYAEFLNSDNVNVKRNLRIGNLQFEENEGGIVLRRWS